MAFTIEKQRKDKWCWAAVSVTIDHYFFPNSTWTQCRVARSLAQKGALSTAPPTADCCQDSDSCNIAARLEDALSAVQRLKDVKAGPLSFTELRAELDANRPVGARIAWQRGGAHFVLICGYDITSAKVGVVDIADPWFGDSTLYYDDFCTAYQFWTNGGGTWTHTYRVQS